MTFYWWSHWFWITLFYIVCVSVMFVSTYPSQEVSTQSNQNDRTSKGITKLFQTTASFTWSTSLSPEPGEGTVLTTITPTKDIYERNVNEALKVYETDNYTDQDETEQNTATDIEIITEEPYVQISNAVKADSEFKRSAEVFKNLTQKIDPETQKSKDDVINLLKSDQIANNLKNDSIEKINSNTSFSNQQNSNLLTSQNLTNFNGLNANVTMHPLAAAAFIPKITNVENNFDFVNSITHLPLSHLPHLSTLQEITTNTGNSDYLQKAPFTLENANKEDVLRHAESDQRTRKPKVLSADYKHFNRVINYSTDSKSLLTRSASTSPNVFDNDDNNNIASEALSVQRAYFLDASAISAICLTIFGVCCTVGTIGIVLYRRRYSNKPQTLSEPDSSVYIDDSTMRDNSDEMYSLDNDSFLNSLEAMTIQNYWTDTVKHTKL